MGSYPLCSREEEADQQSAWDLGTTLPFLALLNVSRMTLGKRLQISDGSVLQKQSLYPEWSNRAGRAASQLFPFSWS